MIQVVWFKRDLRTIDHAALSAAALHGPVLPLYIVEPQLWQQADVSHRQYQFLTECLAELDSALQSFGQGLVVRVGDAVDVLNQLHQDYQIAAIWSHQETWNGWTFQRDKRILAWTQQHTIPWHEPTQNGVIRRLADRDGWEIQWYKTMDKAIVPAPNKLTQISIPSDKLPSADTLGLSPDGCVAAQRGGRRRALHLLDSFLSSRGEHYTKAMSSPVTAFDSCSRLSAHLAYGTLSIREVFQALAQHQQYVRQLPTGRKGQWPSGLQSFSGRLRWHCHFIQKLEDEPRSEFENLHPAYDGLRENDFNQAYFEAWQTGHTGYPMVDACMRALIATGWLNFRMRAMVMSFASYHLWLHWRKPALHLARLFTDYEPGIHYSQVQMQSGTTGINSIRIYNPIKQGIDHDSEGHFIRQWLPELANMPIETLHTPWLAPDKMNGYPMPIVDEASARKSAAAKLYQLRKNDSHEATAKKIVKKHGSRKKSTLNTSRRRKKGGDTEMKQPKQTELAL